MKIIDLSHIISPEMPVYPGTPQPVFEPGSSIENDGFLERKITMFSHTGTHVDAPAHLLKEGKTLDRFRADHFYGKAWVLDHAGGVGDIGPDILAPHHDKMEQIEFLLIRTGWDRYWNRDRYFSRYPVLTAETAEWLAGFKLKGLGLDVISADKADSQTFPIHKILLGKNIIIIENLTNLRTLPAGIFRFSCFPLYFKSADGSPVRAVAYPEVDA